MNPLNRIVAACRRLPRDTSRPADPVTLIATACSELDVERMGHIEGLANRPRPDASADAQESSIGERMRSLAADMRRHHEARLHALMDRCAQLAARFAPGAVSGLALEAKDRLDTLDASMREQLREARRRELEARRDLAAFRDANRLTRCARPAKPLWAVLIFAILAACCEGAINSWAFSAGASGGWREALFTATVVATISIAAGLAAGAAARNLVHVQPARKLAGALTTLMYVAFALEFTAMTARYRSALVFDPDNAAQLAAEQIGQLAFGASDFHTLLLIVASFGFAALSFATGLLASDLYPGYSAVSARWAARHASLLALRRGIGAAAEELTGGLLADIDERVQQASLARSQFATAVKGARDVVSEYRHAMSRVNSAQDELVQRYRRAILVVRDRGLPLPEYMREPAQGAATERAGGEIGTPLLATAESTLCSIDDIERALRAAADESRAAIYRLRAEHAARRDQYFNEAEGMPGPWPAGIARSGNGPALSDGAVGKPNGRSSLAGLEAQTH